MARVADPLSVEDLEARLRSAQDPTATRHVQVIWLLARGHTIADVAAVTSFVPRWIEQLLARYNAHGPEALGDLRRRNGSAPSVLRPELLARLPERLATPPSDGGLWSSRKVAAWMASELGLAAVLPQRGWEALKAIDWSVQKPRPRHPASATPEEREAFKKSWSRPSPRRGPSTRTRRSKSGRPTSTASGRVAGIRGGGAMTPTPFWAHAMRTDSGRPRSSMRLRTWTATSISVARRSSVCERSPSPITRLKRPIVASARARFVYPDAFCQAILPFSAISSRRRSRWVGAVSAVALGTAVARGGTMTAASGWRSLTLA